MLLSVPRFELRSVASMHIFCLYTYREGVLFHGEVTESVLARFVYDWLDAGVASASLDIRHLGQNFIHGEVAE